MIHITKVVRFEMAHAIADYPGDCRNIHGHSYELHVTVTGRNVTVDDFLLYPGFEVDFKELKKLIYASITELLDHKIILSSRFLSEHSEIQTIENLIIWEIEPTAENILIFIKNKLIATLPEYIKLENLKIFETHDSYAEWYSNSLV